MLYLASSLGPSFLLSSDINLYLLLCLGGLSPYGRDINNWKVQLVQGTILYYNAWVSLSLAHDRIRGVIIFWGYSIFEQLGENSLQGDGGLGLIIELPYLCLVGLRCLLAPLCLTQGAKGIKYCHKDLSQGSQTSIRVVF